MRKRGATWMLVVMTLGVLAAARLTAGPVGLASDVKDLGSEDASVRAAATDRVKKLGKDVVPDLLDELAKGHDALTKATLAGIVRDLGVTTTHATALSQLLGDDELAARQAALVILGSAPALARDALLSLAADTREDEGLRAGAAEVVGLCGSEVRSALLRLARDAGLPETVRRGAFAGLARTGTKGCEDVAEIVTARMTPEPLRLAGVFALGRKEVQGAVALKSLIASPVLSIRAAAVPAFAGVCDPTSVSEFVPGLTDPAPEVRIEALRALLGLGGGKTYRDNLIALLLDADDRVVALAARGVGQTCSDIAARVNPTLQGLLLSVNFQVRYEAALALNALGDKTGLAAMQADAVPPNLSQQQQATQAVTIIQGK